jgi:hypothetical protein
VASHSKNAEKLKDCLRGSETQNRPLPEPLERLWTETALEPCKGRPSGVSVKLKSEVKKEIPDAVSSTPRWPWRILSADPLTFFQWIPLPPATSTSQPRTGRTAHESKLELHAITDTDCRNVIAFYQETFPKFKFTVTSVKNGDQAGMVQAENAARRRSVTVTIASSRGGSEVDITAIERF